MWKDKRFLIGLGTGLIVGSILLQLMNLGLSDHSSVVFPDNEGAPEEQQISLEQWTEAAEQFGYAYYPRSEKRYTQAEVDELLEAAVNEADEADERTVTQPAQQDSDNEESNADYVVRIREGMSADEVSHALFEAGIIDDLDTFRQALLDRKLQYKIQYGTFTFAHKPDITEIIETITIR